jgi:hypothetical protein
MTMFLRPLAATVLALSLTLPAFAQSLPQPEGPVILTISGNLTQTNGDGVARFDLAMIEALAQRDTHTTTPWYEGPQHFTGPLMADLLALVGASGSNLRVVAVNDYAANLPWSDIEEYPVILASRRNGETMPVREKGPLFVIYPFDEFPDLRNEVHFSRSAWQVALIEVVP